MKFMFNLYSVEKNVRDCFVYMNLLVLFFLFALTYFDCLLHNIFKNSEMTTDSKDREESTSSDMTGRFVNSLENAWKRLLNIIQNFLREWHVYENLDALALHLARHPVLALVLFAVTLCCGIPILVFLLFVVVTIVLTFTGFIIVEGTILTIGSVFLCGFLISTIVIGLAMASVAAVLYFGFMKLYGLSVTSPEYSPLTLFLPVKFREQYFPANSHSGNLKAVQSDHED